MSEENSKQADSPQIDINDPQAVTEQLRRSGELMRQSQREYKTQRAQERNKLLSDERAIEAFVKQWLKLDTWLLFSEALAVCQAYDPTDSNFTVYKDTDWALEVKKHIEAAKLTSLKVINKNEKPSQWRVAPKEFLNWLNTKGFTPIKPVENAIKSTLEPDTSSSEVVNNRTERFAANREKIYIAALAVLAQYPEKCTINGKVSASAIVREIEEKSKLWFDYDDLPMSQRVMIEHIRKALNTTR